MLCDLRAEAFEAQRRQRGLPAASRIPNSRFQRKPLQAANKFENSSKRGPFFQASGRNSTKLKEATKCPDRYVS